MSSSNVTPVIVRDEIIQDITTQQPVTMLKGASQNTHTTIRYQLVAVQQVRWILPQLSRVPS